MAAGTPNMSTAGNSSEFLEEIFQLMVKECFVEGSKQETKVVEYKSPEELKAELDLSIGKESVDYKTLTEICRKIIRFSVKSAHPKHLCFFYSGHNPAGTAGAWLTDALNANIHNYEAAPALIIIENFVIDELNKLIGFDNGDGIFVPGSSFGNFMAIHLARYAWSNNVKQTGLFGLPRLCIFCSQEAHYSMAKAASFLGLGADSVIQVDSFEGQMKADALDRAIISCKSSGQIPLIAVSTSGTTVTGSFDPLEDITNVCERHGVWLHSDAAWGGAVVYSPTHKHLVKGLSRCDSVVWSLHKMMGAPIQCAVILVKQKGQLQACNSANASYLFSTDKFYDTSYDIGDKTVQCGRTADCLKFWMLWKSRGHSGMAKHVDTAFENAQYLMLKLREHSGFRCIQNEFQYVNICFWYIPPRLQGKAETKEWWQEVGKVAPVIKEKLTKSGSVLLSYQPLESRGLVNFFRIITHPNTAKSDFDFILDEIQKYAQNL